MWRFFSLNCYSITAWLTKARIYSNACFHRNSPSAPRTTFFIILQLCRYIQRLNWFDLSSAVARPCRLYSTRSRSNKCLYTVKSFSGRSQIVILAHLIYLYIEDVLSVSSSSRLRLSRFYFIFYTLQLYSRQISTGTRFTITIWFFPESFVDISTVFRAYFSTFGFSTSCDFVIPTPKRVRSNVGRSPSQLIHCILFFIFIDSTGFQREIQI